MARKCETYPRRLAEEGSDEDKEGSHCKPQEACDRASSDQDPAQTGVQAEEGHVQVIP